MGIFETYIGASGADREVGDGPQSAPILVVAGYLAHADEWRALEADWKLLLDQKGLGCFDMTEFAGMTGPYAAWAATEREEFIQSLLSTIKRWAGVLVAWGIELDDWQNGRQIVKAYTLCALACIATVSEWAKACGYAEKIVPMFDSGDGSLPLPNFITAFRLEDLDTYSIRLPITQPKRDLAPLQAAGILAHQTGCARDKRRMGDNLAPYLTELHRTRGYSSLLNRELLDRVGEEAIRIVDLQGLFPLWPFANIPAEANIITVNLLGAKSYALRVPKRLDLMFAERDPPPGIDGP
jgi:hypothetical protein